MTGVGSEEGTVKFDPIDQNNCSSKRVQNSGIRSIGDLSEVAIRSFAKKDEDVLSYIFPAAFDKYASLVPASHTLPFNDDGTVSSSNLPLRRHCPTDVMIRSNMFLPDVSSRGKDCDKELLPGGTRVSGGALCTGLGSAVMNAE